MDFNNIVMSENGERPRHYPGFHQTDIVRAQSLEDEVLTEVTVIYTTDNGWTIGANRVAAGKATPYADDTNLPFVVRGPGVPSGVKSSLPGSHVDLAPTFLEIAGVNPEDFPPFLDGRSLFDQWLQPESGYKSQNQGVGRELLNVEFWGSRIIEAPAASEVGTILNNSYKTLRLVGNEFSWLFVKWCTNEMELYNTQDDPYELVNLINSTDTSVQQLLTRLNAILMVTKSCTQETCRDPWAVLQPPNSSQTTTLTEALSSDHDAFFASIPQVQFNECMQYQYIPNEGPFYPSGAEEGLSSKFRQPTDNFVETSAVKVVKPDLTKFYGGPEQRNVKWAEILAASRPLTDEELGSSVDSRSFEERDILEWYN
ncbi:hypothetical protein COL154_006205 [Colletotrichum chrysophilum]|nr:hypothetical protein COL154_006205 [Colletotrichum chrysophilum]